MAEAVINDVNLEQNVQLQNQQVPPPDPNAFALPDAYKDKTYLKDVKSLDDVYKKLDGAQTLIGQKVNFLTDQSTDEEKVSFYKSAGMPEKAEEYVFEKFGEEERDVTVDNKFKEIFHKWGLSSKSATGIQKDVETLVAETVKLKTEVDDKAFNELSEKILGNKVDEILASSKKLIEENLPSELAESFKGLSNPALVTMSTVIENFRKKYISEDNITEGDRVTGVTNKAELQKQSDVLMDNPAYKDGLHRDHKLINDQIKEISLKIANLG